MALFPLSLEAIIKRQRFIKAKALSFSQLLLWAGGGQGGRGAGGHPSGPGTVGVTWEQVFILRTEARGWADGFVGARRQRHGPVETFRGPVSLAFHGCHGAGFLGVSACHPRALVDHPLVLSRPLRPLLGTYRSAPTPGSPNRCPSSAQGQFTSNQKTLRKRDQLLRGQFPEAQRPQGPLSK